MSERKRTKDTLLEASTDEAASILAELAALEDSLSVEVDRLAPRCRPVTARTPMTAYRGRPLWWWRIMLLSWADSRRAGASHAAEMLLGLRVVLHEWDDAILLGFLKQLPPTSASAA